jgi:superfamily I DNA/RNA helicase
MMELFRALDSELLRERHLHKSQLARETLAALKVESRLPKYRAVMVDEVQVASENELKLVNAIAQGTSAELLMAGDDDQAILTRGFSFESASIHLQRGVPCVLNGNWRNSKPIVEFLNRFSAVWSSTQDGRKPSAAHGLEGTKPVVAIALSDVDEIRWVASSVIELIETNGFQPGHICCVVRGNDWRARLTNELYQLRPSLPVDANRRAAVNRDSVKVTTIESTLGQEFRAVFVANVTEASFPSTEEKTELARDARLFYTAAGRARDRLSISYSSRAGMRPTRGSRFLDPVLAVCDVVRI